MENFKKLEGKYISMWRRLEIEYEKKIIKQSQNFAIDSEYYEVELLRKNIVMLKAVKQLKNQVIKFNDKQL
jgi:hypothetical protein